MCLAKYSEDDVLYRATVLSRNIKEGKVGCREEKPWLWFLLVGPWKSI